VWDIDVGAFCAGRRWAGRVVGCMRGYVDVVYLNYSDPNPAVQAPAGEHPILQPPQNRVKCPKLMIRLLCSFFPGSFRWARERLVWDVDTYIHEDLPVALDYIVRTSQPAAGRVVGIGHSMGGMLLYGLAGLQAGDAERSKATLAGVVTLASGLRFPTAAVGGKVGMAAGGVSPSPISPTVKRFSLCFSCVLTAGVGPALPHGRGGGQGGDGGGRCVSLTDLSHCEMFLTVFLLCPHRLPHRISHCVSHCVSPVSSPPISPSPSPSRPLCFSCVLTANLTVSLTVSPTVSPRGERGSGERGREEVPLAAGAVRVRERRAQQRRNPAHADGRRRTTGGRRRRHGDGASGHGGGRGDDSVGIHRTPG
jgi:hypothetical protein